MTVGMSTAVRNAMMNALTAQAGSNANLTLYNGIRPATGGATTATALAVFPCGTMFAGAASAGVLTLSILSTNATATGTATWARLTTSSGTFIMDLDVGTSNTDVNLNTTAIVSGAVVAISGATITAGNP